MSKVLTQQNQPTDLKKICDQQRKDLVKSRLENHFPIKTTWVYIVSMALIGIACIVLEILLILDRDKEKDIIFATGIWGGVCCILCSVFALITIFQRTYCWHVTNTIVQITCAIIACVGVISVNAALLSPGDYCRYNCTPKWQSRAEITFASLIVIVFILYLIQQRQINTKGESPFRYGLTPVLYLESGISTLSYKPSSNENNGNLQLSPTYHVHSAYTDKM